MKKMRFIKRGETYPIFLHDESGIVGESVVVFDENWTNKDVIIFAINYGFSGVIESFSFCIEDRNTPPMPLTEKKKVNKGDTVSIQHGSLVLPEFLRTEDEEEVVVDYAPGNPVIAHKRRMGDFPSAVAAEFFRQSPMTFTEELTDGIHGSIQKAVSIVYGDFITKYKHLVQFYDDHNGTPCEQIRHQQQLESMFRRRPPTNKGTQYKPSLNTILTEYYTEVYKVGDPALAAKEYAAAFWDDNVIFDPDPEVTTEDLEAEIAELRKEVDYWKGAAKSYQQQSEMKY